jgi:putative transposase
VIHGKNRPPQRVSRRDRITVCGARSDTAGMLMKLGIQLHLAGLSLSNTVSILEVFGVQRAHSTVHNRVHKVDLQPEDGRDPDHVAVDETVIRLNDEHYWLYAAVDPETNELLRTKLEPTRTNVLAHAFFAELREKPTVEHAVFLVDGAAPREDGCQRHGLDFRYERHGNRSSVERVFPDIKRRTFPFSNCFSNAERETANDWLEGFAFAWNQLISALPSETGQGIIPGSHVPARCPRPHPEVRR